MLSDKTSQVLYYNCDHLLVVGQHLSALLLSSRLRYSSSFPNVVEGVKGGVWIQSLRVLSLGLTLPETCLEAPRF